MRKLLNGSILIAFIVTQYSMKNASLVSDGRVELAGSPFLPIAGLQVLSEGKFTEARVLSDSQGPFEYTTSTKASTCGSQDVKVSDSGVIKFKGSDLYFVCVKTKESTEWQSFAFVEHGLSHDKAFKKESILGLPESESKDRILNLLFPFQSAASLSVGIGFDQRCKNDMVVFKPNQLFRYDLAKLGGKSRPIFLCVSATQADGTKLPTINYSFKYNCTSKFGKCLGSGLSVRTERELALQTLTKSGRIDRENARKSWLALENEDH
jgi:hypothetical protein